MILWVLQVVGSDVQVKIVKNKLAPPFKTAQFVLEFGKGISRESEIIELGIKHKFITKSGSFLNFNGQSYHGKDALKQFLVQNDGAQEELMIKLREKLVDVERENEPAAEASDEEPSEVIISPDSTDEEAGAAVEA